MEGVFRVGKKNEDKAWYDLREGENGGLYIVAGDSEGIKFISVVDFLALDYKGYEINVYSWGNDSYSFGFWIDPEGGILRASDDERSYFFYDDLKMTKQIIRERISTSRQLSMI